MYEESGRKRCVYPFTDSKNKGIITVCMHILFFSFLPRKVIKSLKICLGLVLQS